MEKTNSEFSLDPFDAVHYDVHELIFQHFNYFDVQNLSLVAPSISFKVFTSPACMRNINVVADIVVARKANNIGSRRLYQSVSLTNPSESKQLIEIIESGSCWKTLKLTGTKFEGNEFIELVTRIKQTIEELILTDCKIPFAPFDDLCLPKLKLLNVKGCDLNLLHILSTTQLNVTTLHLKPSNILDELKKEAASKCVAKVLMKCDKISELGLTGWKISHVLPDAAIDKMKFKLKTLSLGSNGNSFNDYEILNRFLIVNSPHLESLSLDVKVKNETLEIIFKMPKLQMLKMSRIKLAPPIELIVNTSINNLHLTDKNLPMDQQKKILENTPNLNLLSIHTISCNEHLEMVNNNCGDLENLTVAYFWASNVASRDYFPRLKHLEIASDVQFTLEQKIRKKPESERTRFENFILNSI